MAVTVSIILPLYNSEDTLRRCVDSVLGQLYKDFELILVDDGSTDTSGAICDEYAKQDDRITVIHKENTGVSDSRNCALEEAKGQYVEFIDSDDWVTPECTDLMVRSLEDNDCDMVISDFYRVSGKRLSRKGNIEPGGKLDIEEFASFMMKAPADFYYGVLWNKLYKREIIEAHHLRMDRTIDWCEDFMFNLEYLLHVDQIYALRIPLYYYVKTKGSLSDPGMDLTKSIRMKSIVFEYYHNFYKSVFTEEDYEKNRLRVYRFLVDAARDGSVPPAVFPGSRKLGEERDSINEWAVSENGMLHDGYRDRKLLQYFLEPLEAKYDITVWDAKLLLCLSENPKYKNRKDLADISGIPRGQLTVSMQKLTVKEWIRTDTDGNIELTDDADQVLMDLIEAETDCERTKFAGFDREEIAEYVKLSSKIRDNIHEVLVR